MFTSSSEFTKRFTATWRRFQSAIHHRAQFVVFSSLKSLDDRQLLERYDQLYAFYLKFAVVANAIDAIDEYLERLMPSALAKVRPRLSGEEENIFLTPSVRTYLRREELALLRTASSFPRQTNEERIRREARRLQMIWWWTPLGWGQWRPHTLAWYRGRLRSLYKKNRQVTLAKIKKNIRRQQIMKHHKSDIYKKHIISSRTRKLAEVFEWLAELHDRRKETQMRGMYGDRLILKEMSRRRSARLDDLLWCRHDEVVDWWINGDLEVPEIHQRKKNLFFHVGRGKFEHYSGRRAEKIDRGLFGGGDLQSIPEIKGLTASPGRVRGHARIVQSSVEAMARIKPGDVLITSMTTPDFVPAMKRAGGVVTEEGGITCHAAIISRELNIPCVTEVKCATEIFKDGDRVIVDASKGLVKKIK